MSAVTRFVLAHDCGLIINPDGLKNQIEGNIIQGVSRSLLEEVMFDASGVTTSRLGNLSGDPLSRRAGVRDWS